MNSGPDPALPAPENNRQRRLGDAAKLVPFLAAILMLVPVLWSLGSATSSAMVYIFSVWGLLIILIGILSRALSRHVRSKANPNRRQEP